MSPVLNIKTTFQAAGFSLPHWPSAGGLLDLGEENYRLLRQLIPELSALGGSHVALGKRGLPLYLEVLEQTPYTSRILLTWQFSIQESPAAELRVYHDARQIEIQRLEGLMLKRDLGLSTLNRRWQEAIFLSKWLGYCCAQGYGFAVNAQNAEQAVPISLVE